jgi:hypothetical protein
MKLARRQFLALAGAAAALPAASLVARAQPYPSRPVRFIVAVAPGGGERHLRAPDGSVALRAPRPTVHCREPAGRRQQYRHRGGREGGPRRLYPSAGQLEQREQRRALR